MADDTPEDAGTDPEGDGPGFAGGGTIDVVELEDEMGRSFLEYAMSVIVSRALPDVRDGLKPVQRRILWAMFDQGMRPDQGYKKCARIVGDVMGKYHPHGDAPIYDALVRMAQDFSLRHLLIDPHGNFGSPDFPAGAPRYTEARLSRLAMELIGEIREDTVDFEPNYDSSEEQPTVLPARFPNLLVNGSQGIAVGMATNIPSHNLGEVIDATIHLLENRDATVADLMRFVKGPDFPTGGYIVGRDGIRQAYETGRGSVRMRAVTEIEEVRKGRTAIVVTQLPYQVAQQRLLEKIAELVRERRIEGIADLRDESDRKGMRLVVELKSNAVPQVVLNQLYKMSQLQDTFGVNTVALVDGVPRTLNLAQVLGHYVDHQTEVIRRRTEHRLRKARERAHILEGLVIALDNLDDVIALIRASASVEVARTGLMERFGLSEIQATHILDMPLRRLTALEQQKLRDELAELLAVIADLEAILASPERVRTIIKDELTAIRNRFREPRRTQFLLDEGELNLEDLIQDDELVITVSSNGYVKSVLADSFRQQRRGGRGVKGAQLGEDDVVEHMVHTTAHAYLLFFSNRGRVYRVKAHEIPRRDRTAKGTAVQAFLSIGAEERIMAVIDTRDYETHQYLVMATKSGQVKKTRFQDYDSSRRDGLIAIRLREDDEVVGVAPASDGNEILMFSSAGQGIRFREQDARAMGRDTAGVIGMRLDAEAAVVSMSVRSADADAEVLLVTANGYAKRTRIRDFPLQGRGGKGVKAIKLTRVRGGLVGARIVPDGAEVLVVTSGGVIMRTVVNTVSRQGRDATGVKLINLGPGTVVSTFSLVLDPGEELTE